MALPRGLEARQSALQAAAAHLVACRAKQRLRGCTWLTLRQGSCLCGPGTSSEPAGTWALRKTRSLLLTNVAKLHLGNTCSQAALWQAGRHMQSLAPQAKGQRRSRLQGKPQLRGLLRARTRQLAARWVQRSLRRPRLQLRPLRPACQLAPRRNLLASRTSGQLHSQQRLCLTLRQAVYWTCLGCQKSGSSEPLPDPLQDVGNSNKPVHLAIIMQ